MGEWVTDLRTGKFACCRLSCTPSGRAGVLFEPSFVHWAPAGLGHKEHLSLTTIAAPTAHLSEQWQLGHCNTLSSLESCFFALHGDFLEARVQGLQWVRNASSRAVRGAPYRGNILRDLHWQPSHTKPALNNSGPGYLKSVFPLHCTGNKLPSSSLANLPFPSLWSEK